MTTPSPSVPAPDLRSAAEALLAAIDRNYSLTFLGAIAPAAKALRVALAASPAAPTIEMRPMESGDGRKGWYVDHPEFFCDIEPDKETGVLSVFFKERATGKEAFAERGAVQPEQAPSSKSSSPEIPDNSTPATPESSAGAGLRGDYQTQQAGVSNPDPLYRAMLEDFIIAAPPAPLQVGAEPPSMFDSLQVVAMWAEYLSSFDHKLALQWIATGKPDQIDGGLFNAFRAGLWAACKSAALAAQVEAPKGEREALGAAFDRYTQTLVEHPHPMGFPFFKAGWQSARATPQQDAAPAERLKDEAP